MEIRMLRYFLAVAQEQSISKAAQTLHITQPTLSRQIKGLEASLDTDLFTRKKGKMVLTESGLFLKKRAEDILYLNDKTEKEFNDDKQELLSGHISVGCVEADNSDTLALMLEEFVAEHNQVTFSIFSGTSDDIVDRLDKGLLDLAILLEPISTDKYHKLVLPRREKWGLMVSSQSYLARKESIDVEELVGIPLLCSGREDVQNMIKSWNALQGKNLNIVGTYNLIFNVFSLVENRVGSALTIEGAMANRDTSNVKFLPIVPELTTNCVLVWKKNTLLPLSVNKLVEKFLQAFQA
ncbi:LysR family transcriptional regulator [Tetragenococcus koreensis]|uniref:LysR family transcriptional regulator n=1 Tax=Tetragenococcus koreensis TaxID=290335 RepID=A0AAN4UAE5_9ENTE|nr:LysR family transcriptional regulator [Tetragenococcus koreensis]MCF1584083.1 LysR family transcriptional regulator [Tetragenococcus koreensis]MCF1613544.1 LysR family transcriptional regulator [Tetragenococcus koreensis]MCF1618717.1 LysR family transcriptional regulator [Tetragenococcus koreensis]MCF1623245.1 LysR family transcriptional regulator [Tetragenococcus koreensis]MCF1628321.1 LysR family transcriptional regulator [Tetragenococcus koreensis]